MKTVLTGIFPRSPIIFTLGAIFVVLFSVPLTAVAGALDSKLYSHIILVPVISSFVMYKERINIFSIKEYSPTVGSIFIIIGMSLYFVGRTLVSLSQNDYLSIVAFAAVLYVIGSFIFIFGMRAARVGAFPLLFLLFIVPIPSAVATGIIAVLQKGSAVVADGLFTFTGVPYIRYGFTFHLETLSVEVAEQCSGIRSSLVLFIISVLAGHIFLRTGWRKIALSVSVFPIAIFKNGVRIVTLSLLGAYVDERILSSALHRRGGIPFFVIALIIWAPILWALRKSEKKELTEKSCLKHLDYNS